MVIVKVFDEFWGFSMYSIAPDQSLGYNLRTILLRRGRAILQGSVSVDIAYYFFDPTNKSLNVIWVLLAVHFTADKKIHAELTQRSKSNASSAEGGCAPRVPMST